MAKYSYEFKLKIVQVYLNGEGGYGYLAKKYNLPSQRTIEYWVHTYNTLGTWYRRSNREKPLLLFVSTYI